MGHVIKLAHSGGPLTCEEALQKIFVITEVAVVSCVKVHKGFRVAVASRDQLTPFLTAKGKEKLAKHGFTPMPSPEMKAQCTVVAKKIDKTILPRSVAEISQEVSAKNKVTVVDVYRPPESRIVKIRVQAPDEAKRLLERGIIMFNTSIPTYNLEPESFIDIEQCLKCYRFGHNKQKCKQTQRCSKCGEDGHFFADCEKPTKCCNCNGEHVAVSGSCPKRKEIIKAKRQQLKQTTKTTYATTTTLPAQTSTPKPIPQTNTAARMPLPPQPIFTPTNITPNNSNKIHTLLHVALIAAKYNAKKFAEITPLLLQKNGFPSIVIPQEIFSDDNLYIPEYSQTNTHTNEDLASHENTQPRSQPLVPDPQPQPEQPHNLAPETTNETNEQKRKHRSPRNNRSKKNKKDPVLPEPSRRVHDNTMLSDEEERLDDPSSMDESMSDSSPRRLIMDLPPEVIRQLQEASALLPFKGKLGEEGRSLGDWSHQSLDGPADSQDSLPDLESSGARPKAKYRENVTPRKLLAERLELI